MRAMPLKAGNRGGNRRKRKDENESDNENELPPEAPPRPFREVYGLPVSEDPPDYNILNHALSVSDSAVLYSSLMRSRKGYVNGNVFDLYWAKGKTKFEKDLNARDRMNKLCDSKMEIGPHTYDVRFFILKDDAIERKREEEKEQKKEKRMANKKLREEQQKIREMKKQGIPLPAQPVAMTSQAVSGPISASPTTTTHAVAPTAITAHTEEQAPSTTISTPAEPSIPDKVGIPKDQDEIGKANDDKDDRDNEKDADSESEKGEESREDSAPLTANDEITIPSEQKNADTSTSSGDGKTPDMTAEETPRRPLPPLQLSSNNLSPQQSQPPAKPPPPPANDIMQTPESQMMIANLNAIARADPSLNTLMKIVASGNATQAQIKEFQGFIQKAKAMGPTPYFRQAFPNYQPPKAPKPEKAPKKLKPPRERLLTAFQEKYVNGADLVFEFSENPNVRYNLPKDCIVEKSGPNEYIISFLVVYNSEQIKKWEARQQAKKEKAQQKEEEEKKAQEMKKESPSKPHRRTRGGDKREHEPDMEQPKVKQEKLKEDSDVKPTAYFSALSFKLYDIDEKYDPIFLNSFREKEQVLKIMEDIIKNGLRAPKYLLWYQVDAYDDEDLAETLREQLELMENPVKKYKKRSVSFIRVFDSYTYTNKI
jgi:SWR1-complex protein 3